MKPPDSTRLYVVIALSLGLVFGADILTSLGVAVWVFYLAPVAMSLSSSRPKLPLLIASVVSIFTAVTYFVDDGGVLTREVAFANRSFGMVTVWVVAVIVQRFIHTRLQMQRQDRLRALQSDLAGRMQGNPSLSTLGDKVLELLGEALGSEVGLAYLREGTTFRRFASYALPAGATVPDVLHEDDGVAGQALRNKRVTVVGDLPDDYVMVGSALGRTPVRHLVVVPAVVDDTVQAVVELGFRQPVDEFMLEALDVVSERVAVAVRAAYDRARVDELLAFTQEQAEELQTQQEELRASNEELEQQGRALRESASRLEAQQTELEQTNVQLSEQAGRLEQQRDELVRTQRDLAARAAELERADRYKSEFLANMSHELRTPLNSALILAKLLADNHGGNLSEEQIRFARTIYDAGNDLLLLINDILDLSKIEAGKVELRRESVDLRRLVETLTSSFQPVARNKDLSFEVVVDAGVRQSVESDSQRLQQVLRNLLSNALKFTREGSVKLRLSEAGNDHVAFAVSDTGIGIPNEQQEVVFEAFRQADGSTHRQYGGTGLGLSISRDLARLLGGEIHLRSQPGEGSTFTFVVPAVPPATGDAPVSSLPLPAVDNVPPPAPAKPPMEPEPPVVVVDDDRARIRPGDRVLLIVEDDLRFAAILKDLAHELGFLCVLAHNAADALVAIHAFSPSAVVLDIHLPDHSGLGLLDQFKSDPRTRHIPVHVVSVTDYEYEARGLGAVGYALKPVRRERLIEAFRHLETRLTGGMRRVLIVEDDARQRQSMEALLGGPEVEIVAVATAGEALVRLADATFDCMVVDLNLPDMSGYELIERMSATEDTSFPPVIVYTGRTLGAEEEQRLRRFSRSIIVKGARSPERLLDEVTLFLHRVESDLPVEHQRMLRESRNRDDALEGRRILVVEDDVRNVFALTSVLEPLGAQVVIARNGREGIDALARARNEPNGAVDLVLMDVMMPEMDGLTAMRAIRKEPAWQRLPIIALTAKAMRDDREECLAAGASDYVAKPLDVEKLLSLVRVWMPR